MPTLHTRLFCSRPPQRCKGGERLGPLRGWAGAALAQARGVTDQTLSGPWRYYPCTSGEVGYSSAGCEVAVWFSRSQPRWEGALGARRRGPAAKRGRAEASMGLRGSALFAVPRLGLSASINLAAQQCRALFARLCCARSGLSAGTPLKNRGRTPRGTKKAGCRPGITRTAARRERAACQDGTPPEWHHGA